MLDEPRLLAANPWVTRRPITVTQYHRMGEVGILGDRDRVELIEGELVAMSPNRQLSPRHRYFTHTRAGACRWRPCHGLGSRSGPTGRLQ